jgi:hypothetical protein
MSSFTIGPFNSTTRAESLRSYRAAVREKLALNSRALRLPPLPDEEHLMQDAWERSVPTYGCVTAIVWLRDLHRVGWM